MADSEVALIVGGGPGISASCARLFAAEGMKVAVAARNIEKEPLAQLAADHGVLLVKCDASDPESVANLFAEVTSQLGAPHLVIHNIDGRSRDVFRKGIHEVDPALVLDTLKNSTFSAFLVGQQAARAMLAQKQRQGHKGTILFTNASAAIKGYPLSGAFAAASHGKSGLAQSMARELMPQGIHIAHRWVACPLVGWSDPRRQYGPPRSNCRRLSSAAQTAPFYLGLRSGSTALGREVVDRCQSPLWLVNRPRRELP
jgi:NAD(P)-dependent dehydrogenase (short-subunit alcohol dehydrogenase family)